MSAARFAGLALAAAGLGLTVGCSSPPPIDIADIELPPGVERYEGPEESVVDLLLIQAIETLPDDTDLDYEILYAADATADPDQWLPGAVARAGFEESDGEVVSVESRWTRGGQTLTWATTPFNHDDGSVTELLILMLTTRD